MLGLGPLFSQFATLGQRGEIYMDEGGEATGRGVESLERVTADERVGGGFYGGRHGV